MTCVVVQFEDKKDRRQELEREIKSFIRLPKICSRIYSRETCHERGVTMFAVKHA